MSTIKKLCGVSLLGLTFAAPGFAQDTAMPAMTAVECEAQFTTLDADANGYLSETEAPQVYARGRIDEKTFDAAGFSHDDFITACTGNMYARVTPEEGAPFEGANSFTEDQAKDRAVAWGATDVSSMTKDDKGIWRGTAMDNGASVKVSVDYKGNVVTSTE